MRGTATVLRILLYVPAWSPPLGEVGWGSPPLGEVGWGSPPRMVPSPWGGRVGVILGRSGGF